VSPNPSNVAALKELWKETGGVRSRLTIAEHEGTAIGGFFFIGFGEVLTLWKKGSLPERLSLHPMELLYHEAFAWGHSCGYRFCDLGGLNRQIAERRIAGLPLTDEQKRSRDQFKLGFGGDPVLLREAFLYFPNRALSTGFRLMTATSLTRGWLLHAARRLESG